MSASGTRASDDAKMVVVNTSNISRLEVSSMISCSILDYQKMLENGTANMTRLYISNKTVFNPGSAMIDDTGAI